MLLAEKTRMSNKATFAIIVFLLLLGGALWVSAMLGVRPSGRSASPVSLTSAQRAEARASQDKACSTVNRLQRAGGFTKIQGGYSGVTHAYVDRGFYEVPVDAKETTMKAVALCYIDLDKQNQLGLVIIHDGYSGKQIGTFDFASGLNMD